MIIGFESSRIITFGLVDGVLGADLLFVMLVLLHGKSDIVSYVSKTSSKRLSIRTIGQSGSCLNDSLL